MLQPKRTKFRKAFKGRIHGNAKGGTTLSLRRGRPQGDGARALDRPPDRSGAPRHRAPHEACGPHVDPHFPGRSGVEEAGRSPHGLGQGLAELWVARVKPGRIIFEIGGVNHQIAKEALMLGAAKLPIKTRVVMRLG